ncbi:hypothetical protein KPL71_022874 [Citrus sinensis]|uniref:Uncharacterized protein n=1 Tax=Citrus sinensis TaxID=2711 RepID=A0ACB8IFK1_CITSI|nr:hypothetical protein KPL71_022874 [Citrus sinensis]
MEVKLDQHSGYVTVDAKAGRALFYYFVESANSSTEPLVLWLNGVTKHHEFLLSLALLYNCIISTSRAWRSRDRFESIAMENVYPIKYARTVLRVGFSYSNTSSDYDANSRGFIYLSCKLILQYNKISNQTFINLKGLPVSIRLEYIHPFLLEYTSSAEFTSCKMLPAFHGRQSIDSLADYSRADEMRDKSLHLQVRDDRVPTRSTGYSMNKLGAQVNTPWYPWYTQGEVGF